MAKVKREKKKKAFRLKHLLFTIAKHKEPHRIIERKKIEKYDVKAMFPLWLCVSVNMNIADFFFLK